MAAGVTAADVQADRHIPRPLGDRLIEQLDVFVDQLLGLVAPALRFRPALGIAKECEGHVIELQITAAGIGQVGDFALIGEGEILEERIEIGVGDFVDAGARPYEVVQVHRRRHGQFRRRPRDRSQIGERLAHDRFGPANLAGNPYTWNRAPVTRLIDHYNRRFDAGVLGHAFEAKHKVRPPRAAPELAVGCNAKPHRFLQGDRLADGLILQRAKLLVVMLAKVTVRLVWPEQLLARAPQALRPQHAADVLGMKRRIAAQTCLSLAHVVLPEWLCQDAVYAMKRMICQRASGCLRKMSMPGSSVVTSCAIASPVTVSVHVRRTTARSPETRMSLMAGGA